MRIVQRLAVITALLAAIGTEPTARAWADPPSDAIADVVAKVQPSVVRIISVLPRNKPSQGDKNQAKAGDGKPTTAIGSGFVIDPSGLIATNRHVVDNAVSVFVGTKDGGRYRAELIGFALKADIALLRVDLGTKLPAVGFGDSDKLRVGDTVIAIGSPFGFDDSVTAGIVSAVNRDILETPFDDYIQTDAAINHGNSGGPLFNLAGQVIGMNSVLFAPGTGSVGVGFAIPSNDLSFVVERLEKYGKVQAGLLPIRTQQVSELMAQAIGARGAGGALVAAMAPRAEQMHNAIHVGDVILSFNGETVTDPRDLARKAARAVVGGQVSLQICRGGETLSVVVPILPVELPSKPTQPLSTRPKTLGLQFMSSSGPDGSTGHGARPGVTVESVDPLGSAADSGLHKGDVIVRVQQQDVAMPQQALAALLSRASSKNHYAAVLVRRDKTQTWIPVALPN